MSVMRSRLFTCLLTNLILFSLTLSVSAQLAPSAASLRQQTALKLIPADASFCSIMLRNREQFDRVANSKAIQKLMNMAAVQQLIGMATNAWENPSDADFEEFKEFVEGNQELTELLKDAVSQEIFFYGGDGFGRSLRLFNEFNNQMNMSNLSALGSGGGPPDPSEFIVSWLEKNLDDLNAVDAVMGMKVTDTERAEKQIKRLEDLIRQFAEEEEEAAFLKDALKRRRIAGSEFLTLNLTGEMIPWEEMDIDDSDIDSEKLESIHDQLKKKTVVIALGIHQNYLVLAAGKDDSVLTKLGTGPLLVDHAKLAPVLKSANKRLTQIGYASESLMREASSTEQQIEQMQNMGKALLPLAELSDDAEQRIKADVDELANDIKSIIPEPGAVLGFNFMTDTGYEGYQYNWAKSSLVDSSKPLSILNHVGGDPLMFVAARSQYQTGSYETLVKWIKKGYGYFEEFGLPEMSEDDREKFEEAADRFLPLITRMDQVNRNMLLPAFADGQSALVLDAKQTSRQWQAAMPAADEPLPMLELAAVYGISDKSLLMKGFTEYFDIAQQILKNLNEMEPNQVPPVQIPPPETKAVQGGTIHYYRLPAMVGFDKAIAPNTGISESLFVMSLMPKMTQRLLEGSELQAEGPLSQKKGKPLYVAWQVRFADLVDAIEPWAAYSAEVSGEDEAQDVVDQATPFLEIVRCFKSASGVGYTENGATVMHYESRFEDID